MKRGLALLAISLAVTGLKTNLPAQDAAQPEVSGSPAEVEQTPPPLPSPIPSLPELSTLDQAFNQTGLGKDADDNKMRIELRNLQNQVARDPEVLAAKAAAEAAPTDLEKREKLLEYYNLNYGLMARKASNSAQRAAIEQTRKEHVSMLAQPRVRPGVGESPVPTPKKKKKHPKKKFG
jgi:hypothetical protein